MPSKQEKETGPRQSLTVPRKESMVTGAKGLAVVVDLLLICCPKQLDGMQL